jgi:hypothetical protein
MPSRAERYLAHIDALSGGVDPVFDRFDEVTVIRYHDLPKAGLLTGLTYGLSLGSHPEWRLGKPELCICVRSRDPAWAFALGQLAMGLRGACPFAYGDTINFNERVSEESDMTAFVVFAPAVLDRNDFTGIDVGDELPINIAGMYPIHEVERLWIHEHGLKAFWELDWDPGDVGRPPAV